jgi:acyl-coenzyme A synthetase/AMP-(fatty) acid ligase
MLLRHPQIKEAAVISKVSGLDGRLLAFIVARARTAPATEQVRDFLRRHLPEFMVPASFVPLERLPVTPNGKVDRAALERIEDEKMNNRSMVAPRTPLEER